MLDENSQLAGFAKITYDMTEHHPAEESQERLHVLSVQARQDAEESNASLNKRARHLEAAPDRVNQANQAKSRCLAGMSHELRTLLNGILGDAQLLHLEGGLNTARLARVEAIMGAGKHLLQVIDTVLDLPEIEAERVELRKVKFVLCSVARARLDVVYPTAQAKGLRLGLVIEPNAPSHVTSDPTRLPQILFKLLGNAVKFPTRGSAELRLSVAAERPGARLEVTDPGREISAEHRHDLFQEFERVDTDVTRGVECAGFGLAISAYLASLIGGGLDHEDNPGGGSSFWLELPLVVGRAQSALAAMPTPDWLQLSKAALEDPTAQTAAASHSARVRKWTKSFVLRTLLRPSRPPPSGRCRWTCVYGV
jgi:signal transduction histidine kinase